VGQIEAVAPIVIYTKWNNSNLSFNFQQLRQVACHLHILESQFSIRLIRNNLTLCFLTQKQLDILGEKEESVLFYYLSLNCI